MANPSLPKDGNYSTIQAQGTGFKRTRAVTIPASTDADGILLNATPNGETTIMVIWIPKAVVDDMTVFGDIGGVHNKALPSWVQDHGTRDVLDAVALAQASWRGISTGAAFTAYVTEIG